MDNRVVDLIKLILINLKNGDVEIEKAIKQIADVTGSGSHLNSTQTDIVSGMLKVCSFESWVAAGGDADEWKTWYKIRNTVNAN